MIFPWLFNPLVWILVGPFMLFAAWCSIRVKTTINRFARVGVRSGMTGAEAAAAVARVGGAQVQIERIGGMLTDHYDPRTKTLRLSPEVYDGRSVSSIAVAAHEAGHAIQDVREYAPLGLRSSLVPVTAFGSRAWIWIFIVGLLLGGASSALGSAVAMLGVALFGVTVLFQIVTLPVEFDASNRAKAVLTQAGIVTNDAEASGVSSVLRAAAMTYVAAALLAIAQLLYFIMILLGNRD